MCGNDLWHFYIQRLIPQVELIPQIPSRFGRNVQNSGRKRFKRYQRTRYAKGDVKSDKKTQDEIGWVVRYTVDKYVSTGRNS